MGTLLQYSPSWVLLYWAGFLGRGEVRNGKLSEELNVVPW